jgi:signal transduction histidine kinase
MLRILAPSLFKRMFAAQAAVVLLFVAANGLLAWRSFDTHDSGVIDQDLKLIAEAMARMAAMQPDAEGARRAAEEVEEMNRHRSDPPIRREEFAYRVWSADGRLLARSAESPPLPELRPGEIGRRERTRQGEWLLMAATSPRGEVVAVVGYSCEMLTRLMWRTLWDLLPVLLLGLTQVTVALALASRVGLAPLTQLSQAIEQRQPGDEQDLPTARHRELQPIADAMNRLLERVRRQRQQERAFFADAAHELRTPLAVINAQAHALAATPSGEERRDALRALEAGVDRSAGVLDKLLTLARLDAGVPQPRDVDVAALARGVVARQLDRTQPGGHDLGMEVHGPAWARVDPQALEAALDNLIDNALRYTPPGSRVDVRVQADGDGVALDVEDNGPGVPEADRERVFRRFERGGQPAGQRGSGLGLAIVAEALRHCGGRVTLDRSPTLGGARFAIWLPRADATA